MGVAAGVGVGVGDKFTVGHAIFVHARPAPIHLHWLQKLFPVSFPDHPSLTISPSVKVQVPPSSGAEIGTGVGVTVGGNTVRDIATLASTVTSKLGVGVGAG